MTPQIQNYITAANSYAEKHGIRAEPFAGALADEVKRLDDLVNRYDACMCNLCSWLGAGGYNNPPLALTPEKLEQRIRDGVDILTSGLRYAPAA